MPSALSDPSPTLYIVLGVVTIILAALWVSKRKRSSLIQFAVAAGVLLIVFLCDYFVESPREQVVRKMHEMSAATQNRRMDEAFRHISESFNYNSMTKAALRERARWAEGQSSFQGVSVTSFERADARMIDDKTVQLGFEAFPTGFPLPEWRFYCLAKFTKDPDGEFRLSGLEFHKANQGAAGPVVVPPHMDH